MAGVVAVVVVVVVVVVVGAAAAARRWWPTASNDMYPQHEHLQSVAALIPNVAGWVDYRSAHVIGSYTWVYLRTILTMLRPSLRR